MLPLLLDRYDAALLRFGAAVIEADPDERRPRFAPLPLPESARLRLDRETRETHAASPTGAALEA